MTKSPLTQLSTTEYAVLGVLAGGDAHGFAIARELGADGGIGRVLTVRRPLVYRALDRLVQFGLATPVATEKGSSGPRRYVHRITEDGTRALDTWLATPVDHVRELRIDFLLKVTLIESLAGSPLDLIRRQRQALAPTFEALGDEEVADPVELWRRHNAAAAAAYLADLEIHTVG